MSIIDVRRTFGGALCAAALSVVLSGGAIAQGTPPSGEVKPGGSEAADKLKDAKITLNVEQENLVDALRTFLKCAKADFLIDDELKAGRLTVHLTDVPFKDALATILKVSTLPIEYELKDGIYHFKRKPDPPPAEEKPADVAKPSAPETRAGKISAGQLGSVGALRKLTGAFDQPPPMLRYHSTLPGSHGTTSSFGLSGGGLLNSNSIRYNPDGSISRSSLPPINIFGLLRGLLGR